MTDDVKNLLELAAKAAKLKNYRYRQAEDGPHECIEYDDEDGYTAFWFPHLNDGDALRLAVQLKLALNFLNKQTAKSTPTNKYGVEPWVDCASYWDSSHSMYFPFSEKCGDDPYAATRLVIVRAAAEIGKTMS